MPAGRPHFSRAGGSGAPALPARLGVRRRPGRVIHVNARLVKTAAVAAAVLALVLAGAQWYSVNLANPGTESDDYDYFTGLPVAGMTIGNADAPVLVEEYMDFQCPACQTASDQVVKPLIEKYVAQGQVRFAYRMFPFLGPESVAAAQGAYCAAVQGGFWPYQQVLFAQRATGNRGIFSDANLIKFAGQVGLDEAAFSQCLNSDDARAYAQGSYERARQLGIPGTPTFFVNGRAVQVNSLAALEREIEAALRQSGQ